MNGVVFHELLGIVIGLATGVLTGLTGASGMSILIIVLAAIPGVVSHWISGTIEVSYAVADIRHFFSRKVEKAGNSNPYFRHILEPKPPVFPG